MQTPLFYIKNLSLSFGDSKIFKDISFQIFKSDRVCLIGKNGSGKSTLLKVIAGIMECDKGELYYAPNIKIGYLAQQPMGDENLTIKNYVLKNISLAHGEVVEEKEYLANIIIDKLELNPDEYIKDLSGGKFRRADLARTLVSEPDLLLLDEPTNHLDISSILWLEDFINQYQGAVLVVSHDRSFLKNISNKTIWLDRGELQFNVKGYSDFERWSEEILLREEKEITKLEKELDKENIWLQQGVTARRKRNQQRLSNLYELREKLKSSKERRSLNGKNISLSLEDLKNKAKLVLEMKDVSFSYKEVSKKYILKPFSLDITRGEVIGVIGKNGSGKTTLIKLITGTLSPSSGEIKYGSKLEFSYLDQSRSELNEDHTLWETLCPNGGDTVFIADRSKHVVAYLKDFLFSADQAKAKVSSLSGGERNRLLLAKILTKPGNFLILDEPTNDLDVDTLDMLVEILYEYKGTCLIVSHDRDFLERVVTRTLVIEDGKVNNYYGGYNDYIAEHKKTIKNPKASSINFNSTNDFTKKTSNKLTYKDQRELDLIPGLIDKLMIEIEHLEQMLADESLYAKGPEIFNQASLELVNKKNELEKLENRWLELSLQ